MFIQIDLESEVPIYMQLIHAIKEGIATGKLKRGGALLSVRAMAAELGVNMHTVNKAYQQLKQEELVLIHRQRGVVINPDLPMMDKAFMENFDAQLKQLAVDAICRGMNEEEFKQRSKLIFSQLHNSRDGEEE